MGLVERPEIPPRRPGLAAVHPAWLPARFFQPDGRTGAVSTALREALKGRPGIKVRALVHDPAKGEALEKDGYEVAVGDLEEPDTLPEAFEGVDILWLLTPASALEPSMGSNAVHAARG